MLRCVVVAFLSLTLAIPLFGKTHNSTYAVPCSQLWNAVQDMLKTSGNYDLILADPNQMTASYKIKGAVHSRTNSVHLNSQNTSCEMQIDSSYSGLLHDDASDFKSRVDASLAKMKSSTPPVAPAKPDDTATKSN